MESIGIIGAGGWGTALAIAISNADNNVLIYARNAKIVDDINQKHSNTKYLNNIILSDKISATSNISLLCALKKILLVVPSQTLRDTCKLLKNNGISSDSILIICCKGIERDSNKLMSEVVSEILPDNPIAILSGPNFAHEIALGLPAGATLACTSENLGMDLVKSLGSSTYRIYYSSDVIGAQIGGAVKNVLAIACGIAIGKGLGENARASLVTRGIAEISRLCEATGGNMQTLMGLSGIGDIILTCGSLKSRNMSFGYEFAQGNISHSDKLDKLVEGVATSYSVCNLARSLNLDMPICEAVKKIIYERQDINDAISKLLHRKLTKE
jgi:glycerol-3-phosphate dehydrogenase (NAD(P)+)